MFGCVWPRQLPPCNVEAQSTRTLSHKPVSQIIRFASFQKNNIRKDMQKEGQEMINYNLVCVCVCV